MQKVEDRCSYHQGEEEELSLSSQQGEWGVERTKYGIESSLACVEPMEFESASLRSGKQPRHEVHGTNGHADAKDYASQGALGSALAECKHESADHDGD